MSVSLSLLTVSVSNEQCIYHGRHPFSLKSVLKWFHFAFPYRLSEEKIDPFENVKRTVDEDGCRRRSLFETIR